MERSSGILLPVFSLPSKYGIGTLGQEAYNFIDFLKKAGQRYWQMLPLGPTGFCDSPYQSFSSFAGNHYFIDFDSLIDQGLVIESEVESYLWGEDPGRVDYGAMYEYRNKVLKVAYHRFSQMDKGEKLFLDFKKFCKENGYWLKDYTLFMALKKHFKMEPWYKWEDLSIKERERGALEKYRNLLAEEIEYQEFIQYLFFYQWDILKKYADEKGIRLIGDLPIYIPMDSSEAWSSRNLLQFDEKGRPKGLGGVPPDYFSKTGQLWGNPLYDWEAMEKDGYDWWIKRLEILAAMFDCIRLDHFRGFESYWSIPPGEKTAVKGRWIKGPGIKFIDKIKESFPKLEIIAEDLGILTEEARELVKKSGFPGMKVLQFAFGSGNSSDYLPHRYSPNSVVYVGTHDNTTVRGWLEEEASLEERNHIKAYFSLSSKEGWNWGIIRGAMASVANLSIIQMQDYLDLPGEARINMPGTLGGNWQWRLKKSDLSENLAEKIRKLSLLYER